MHFSLIFAPWLSQSSLGHARLTLPTTDHQMQVQFEIKIYELLKVLLLLLQEGCKGGGFVGWQ